MYKLIQKNRLKLNNELGNSLKRKFFSPALLCEYENTLPRIRANATGRLLDVGCGSMPFKKFIQNSVTEYHGLDIERRTENVQFLGDIQDMKMIESESYDTVICLNVLEHIPNPFRATTEIYRVLKKRGKLILSVPHPARLHEEPHDYYRFTKYGLNFVLNKAGFEVLKIIPNGGLFCFLGHQFSTIFVCLFWHIPVLKNIVFFLNRYLCTELCFWFDKVVEKKKNFALGYICIAKKGLLRI